MMIITSDAVHRAVQEIKYLSGRSIRSSVELTFQPQRRRRAQYSSSENHHLLVVSSWWSCVASPVRIQFFLVELGEKYCKFSGIRNNYSSLTQAVWWIKKYRLSVINQTDSPWVRTIDTRLSPTVARCKIMGLVVAQTLVQSLRICTHRKAS